MVEPLEPVLIRCDQKFTKELSLGWELRKGLSVWWAVVMVGVVLCGVGWL